MDDSGRRRSSAAELDADGNRARRPRSGAGAKSARPASESEPVAPLVYAIHLAPAETVDACREDLPRVAAMGFDTLYVTPPRDGDADAPALSAAARRCNLRLMTDLAVDGATLDAVDKQLGDAIAALRDRGFDGFRCVAAHRLPAETWRAVITGARAQSPPVVFCADTLGAPFEATMQLRGAGFDFVLNSFAWWDGRSPWFLEQHELLRRVAPAIGFPDLPFGAPLAARLAAAGATDPAHLAAAYRQRYALAACCSAGVMMPKGFEWGREADGHDPNGRLFDLADFLAAFNRMRRESPALQVDGALLLPLPPDDPVLAVARRSDEGAAWSFLLLNRDAHTTRVAPTDALLAAAGDLPLALAPAIPEPGLPISTPGIDVEPLGLRLLNGNTGGGPALEDRPSPAGAHRPQWEPDARIVIESVSPAIDAGRFPAKRIVGEEVEVAADILRDGHDKLAAIVKYRRAGETSRRSTAMRHFDNDRWVGSFVVGEIGRYLFAVEAWTDHFASWCDEVRKKRAAGQDVAIELIEGRALVAAARARADATEARVFDVILDALDASAPEDRAALLLSRLVGNFVARWPDRGDKVSSAAEYEVVVSREAARFAAWYELFPRSQGRIAGQGASFDDCIARLPEIAALGFDVVYLVPIHPIGRTNRKGRDNATTAAPGDPGSPYAIGAAEGGHCAVNAELGTLDDFRRFARAASAHGMEVALDFAVQCAPDHPWIRDHPQWFRFRPDGTVKFAENPPKKYQDIVNVDFDNPDRAALWQELRDVILFWAREGVRTFRVDNPHTKPVPFWEWCIREVQARYPDTIFLAEAFTRPKVMKLLAKAGFTQSYSYFTWRNTKRELIDYLSELTHGPEREYMQPNFFANTPDILPKILQDGHRAAFLTRLVLAATLSPVYGIYNGFELCENTAIPGTEEYLHSEKYEYKVWDWDRPGNIKAEIAALNRFRRENPALRLFANLTFCDTDDEHILAYVKDTRDRSNIVLVIANLDPFAAHEAVVTLPLQRLGIAPGGRFHLDEALSGAGYDGQGEDWRWRIDPQRQPAFVFRLVPQ
jgi:starch synthase (maltosyl-transferring)